MAAHDNRGTSTLVLGSFLVFAVLFAASFGFTMQAYDGFLAAKSTEASVTGYDLERTATGRTMTVSVEVRNPANHRIVIEEPHLRGSLGDRHVGREAPGPAHRSVGPKETRTVEFELRLFNESDRTIQEILDENATVSGYLEARIVDKPLEIDVTSQREDRQ
jgi:hypothetical protein